MELEKGTVLKTIRYGRVKYGNIVRINKKTYTINDYELIDKKTMKDTYGCVWIVISQKELEEISSWRSQLIEAENIIGELSEFIDNIQVFQDKLTLITHKLNREIDWLNLKIKEK